MPRVSQLSRLFQSLAAGDHAGAVKAAQAIADEEDRRGHHGAAKTLRGSLNTNGQAVRPVNGVSLAGAETSATSMLIPEMEGPDLSEVMLRGPAREALREVILEWQHEDSLREAHISRRRSLLLAGPPGCGKTLTARALGRELSVPVITARLSSIIGSYLGQTGSNLRQLFAYAQSTPCVLLLDEFDALARKRGRSEDVGELDRVVISLLQELDHTAPAGLIVAATNMEETLDPALWRRFDLALTLPRPNKKELRTFARRRLRELNVPARKALIEQLERLRTYADVARALEDHRRRQVLRSFEK